MANVYHLMPKNLRGNTLYPLNQLKDKMPDVFERHMRKYRGREVLLERRIPILNCLWNDVLFFSPVHPEAIRNAVIAAGGEWRTAQWYEIDTEKQNFTVQNTIVYTPNVENAQGDFIVTPEQFAVFTSEVLERIRVIPQAALAYYRHSVISRENIFLWRGIPHVLHLGSIPLDQTKRIEV